MLAYSYNSNMNSMGKIKYFLTGFKMIIHAFYQYLAKDRGLFR